MRIEWIWAYAGWVLCASGVTLVLYGWDKRQARRGGRRTPERTLQLWALAGGWPGAWFGRRVFRHKTRKVAFVRVLVGMTAAHCVAVAAAWWALKQ